jgi:hypothetical protein
VYVYRNEDPGELLERVVVILEGGAAVAGARIGFIFYAAVDSRRACAQNGLEACDRH